MGHLILPVSDRGQVTLPKTVRDKIPVKYFICTLKGNQIMLEPLQTRDEFLEELGQSSKEWEKKGGLSLPEVRKKYEL